MSLLTLLIVEPFRAPRYAAQLTAPIARFPSHILSLGNDPELDPDREPEPPTKAIDKPAARAGKRNAPAEAPVRDAGRGGRGGHRDGFGGNEGGTLSCQPISVSSTDCHCYSTCLLSCNDINAWFANNLGLQPSGIEVLAATRIAAGPLEVRGAPILTGASHSDGLQMPTTLVTVVAAEVDEEDVVVALLVPLVTVTAELA